MTTDPAIDLTLRNGVPLVGENLIPTPFTSLVVNGGVISSTSEDIVDADGAPELHLRGAYILPGLID